MTIKDDGIGFVANDRKRHFGLATMHERAKSVNGDLNVDSKPGFRGRSCSDAHQ
jgi:signal transduction histidine kinase